MSGMNAHQNWIRFGVNMHNYKKKSVLIAAGFVGLFLSMWVYYAFANLNNIYNLIDCSQGEFHIPLIPQHFCRIYLYEFRGSRDDVAIINHDGSLIGLLSTANKKDQVKLLEFLLNKGVDINGLDERSGISPLHAAVLDNDADVAELILKHGANPLLKDRKRRLTPSGFARQLREKSNQPDRSAIIYLLDRAENK
jgi:hypothetical protein